MSSQELLASSLSTIHRFALSHRKAYLTLSDPFSEALRVKVCAAPFPCDYHSQPCLKATLKPAIIARSGYFQTSLLPFTHTSGNLSAGPFCRHFHTIARNNKSPNLMTSLPRTDLDGTLSHQQPVESPCSNVDLPIADVPAEPRRRPPGKKNKTSKAKAKAENKKTSRRANRTRDEQMTETLLDSASQESISSGQASPRLTPAEQVKNQLLLNENSSDQTPSQQSTTPDSASQESISNGQAFSRLTLAEQASQLVLDENSQDQQSTSTVVQSPNSKHNTKPISLKLNPMVSKWLKEESCVFVSIDVEQWERNTHLVTEIGIAVYRPSPTILPEIRVSHFIVSEYLSLLNGRFVEDNKSNFAYGKSLTLSKLECVQRVNNVIKALMAKYKRVVIVGHNVGGDVKALRAIGVAFPKVLDIADTMNLWRETRPVGPANLEALLKIFRVPYSFLHNAGMFNSFFSFFSTNTNFQQMMLI